MQDSEKETIDALITESGSLEPNVLALDVPGCGTRRDRNTESLGIEDVASELISSSRASRRLSLAVRAAAAEAELFPPCSSSWD